MYIYFTDAPWKLYPEPWVNPEEVHKMHFSPQVALVDMIIEPNVVALWFSHNKTLDDRYKNDYKFIYYPNDSDNSWKEKIMISMVTKVSLWKTILKPIELP